MKQKLLFGFAALTIAAVVTFTMNVTNHHRFLLDISLANVEALAASENGSNCQGCLVWDTESNSEGVKCKSDGCTEEYKGYCVKWCGE